MNSTARRSWVDDARAVASVLDPRRRRSLASPRRFDDDGQGIIEYGLILVVMAVVCTVSLLFFSDQLSTLLSLIASAV